jgi:hypothetical protein
MSAITRPKSDHLHHDALVEHVGAFGALAGLLRDHDGYFEWHQLFQGLS